MKLDADGVNATFGRNALQDRAFVKVEPDRSFESFLGADLLKQKNDDARAAVLASQQKPAEPETNADMAFIRENGFRAYAVEVHERKVQELREKILESMGLNEETLSELPAEQRMAIEKLVDEEVKKRMAAASVMNGEGAKPGAPPTAASNQQVIAQLIGGQLEASSGTAAAFDPQFGGAEDEPDTELGNEPERDKGRYTG